VKYTTASRSEIPGKFFSVVLEKDGDKSDTAKSEELLHRAKEEGNILLAVKKRKAN